MKLVRAKGELATLEAEVVHLHDTSKVLLYEKKEAKTANIMSSLGNYFSSFV